MFNSQTSQAFTDGLRSVSTDLTPALKLKKDFTVMAAVTVKELAKDLNVAESTIKNNINELR